MAFLILGLGGWKWAVPIVVFFISSSIISKVKTKYKEIAETNFEKAGIRDWLQVLANGGAAGIFVVLNSLYPSELFYLAYVSCLSVVCSDTWGTEIGTLFRVKTVSIRNFKEVEQGTSGGISITGSIGAIIGAFIIPISSLFWINSIFIISAAGLSGNIIDSIFGAVFQAQFNCSICGKITERKYHCNNRTSLIKGIKWMNNDAINFFSSVAGSIFLLILIEIFNK